MQTIVNESVSLGKRTANVANIRIFPKKNRKNQKTPAETGVNYLTKSKLLNFYFSASFFQLCYQSISVSFANTFLNGLRSAVYQILGFFQTKTSQVLNNLHDVQLVRAGGFQD